mgnify:FL=1
MKEYSVISLGEALVDFVPVDGTLPGRFNALPGGAPTNVACGLGRLGLSVALIARIGSDPLGRCLLQTLEQYAVDDAYVQIDPQRFTTVTIVMPKSEDMLRYAIYRSGSADGALSFQEIPAELFSHARVLHYGSLCMASESSRQTTLLAIQAAKDHGMMTSVDVNLRPNSWKSGAQMAQEARRLVELSDIVKLTLDEARLLALDMAALTKAGKIVIVTDGANGASIHADGISVSRPAMDVDVLDVTGGGDAFMSAFLYYYTTHCGTMPLRELLGEALSFCVASSSVAIQRYGGISSLPTLEEIHELEAKNTQ